MEWEEKYDCLRMFSKWIADKGIASSELCEQLKVLAKIHVRDQKNEAWSDFVSTGQFRKKELLEILKSISGMPSIDQAINSINSSKDISWHELVQIARQCLGQARKGGISSQMSLLEKWISNQYLQAQIDYHAHLYSETNYSALKVPEILPEYSNSSKELNGYQVINQYFDQLLAKHSEVLAFGEDVGMIGDVNQ